MARVQAPKPRNGVVRTRSVETMEFQLQGRGGRHKSEADYRRRPKHMGRGWE